MTEDLHVEFDGQQVVVRTDAPEVRDYVTRNFEHMLGISPQDPIGRIEVSRTESGYRMLAPEAAEYPGPPEHFLPVIKNEIRRQFMKARPDLLWLHAAAVERGGAAILLSGRSGQGKSTLATLLLARGYRLLSDDVSPVRMTVNEVIPFPQTPVHRVSLGREVAEDAVAAIERETVVLGRYSICSNPAPIAAMVFIRYQYGMVTKIERLTQGSGAMEFLRNATNFVDHRGAAVSRAAEFARTARQFSLTYASAPEAASVLERLLDRQEIACRDLPSM